MPDLFPAPTFWSRVCSLTMRTLPVVMGIALAFLPVDASADNPPAKKKKKKKKTEQVEKGDKGEKGFDLPIPIGHSAEGVKLPDYDANGKLQMNFEIGSALRVDDDHLKMTDLRIETFGDEGTAEMLILMPVSVFDLKTRIVSSVDPVTVQRSDFEVTGGNMTFDTRTRQGKFTGPIRMLIFNHDDLNAPKEEKTDE